MNIFRRKPNRHAEFSAMVASKSTRTELVHLRNLLREANAHPGKIHAVEKRIARLEGYRGA